MASSENDGSGKQTTDKDVQEKGDIYEDEINLIGHLIVLWKWKWLILVFSILPTFVVWVTLFSSPKDYKVTYVYDLRGDLSNWDLTEKNYNILVSSFYSKENLAKIVKKLRDNGITVYAERLSAASGNPTALNGLLKFEPLPSYPDLSKMKMTTQEQLEQMQKLTAQLLNISIVGKPKGDVPKISSVIRDNLENVTPVYMAQEQLSASIRGYKAMMARIESSRFSLKLALKTNKSALGKLKSMEPRASDGFRSNVTLQFDVGGKSEHLPLVYQIQALESEIVKLEKRVEGDEENYKYYKDLLALNEKLLGLSTKSIASYYTIQEYHSFLLELNKRNRKAGVEGLSKLLY
ncbi:MAG: hypothetical protein FVQ80_00345 [Planctomycetes bacterium]|nr:hypothetical protein [Planctomycetota bacterium]